MEQVIFQQRIFCFPGFRLSKSYHKTTLFDHFLLSILAKCPPQFNFLFLAVRSIFKFFSKFFFNFDSFEFISQFYIQHRPFYRILSNPYLIFVLFDHCSSLYSIGHDRGNRTIENCTFYLIDKWSIEKFLYCLKFILCKGDSMTYF